MHKIVCAGCGQEGTMQRERPFVSRCSICECTHVIVKEDIGTIIGNGESITFTLSYSLTAD